MLYCILLAAVLVGYAGYKLYYPIGLSASEYDRIRASWSDYADMVACGDSRTMESVCPTQMQNSLPNQTIVNFSFCANGYNATYLQAIERILSRQSPKKTVLMGITPHTLTLSATNYNEFTSLLKYKPNRSFVQKLDPIYNFFKFQRPSVFLKAILSPKTPPQWYAEYYPDGWVASVKPHTPRFTLDSYHRWFRYEKVSPQVITQILDQVRIWTQQGIRVYGFRPPTSNDMVQLENEISGFNEPLFMTQFHAAGGIWIPVNQTAYSSYDGSHLHREAAIAFSNDLAREISKIQNQPQWASRSAISSP